VQSGDVSVDSGMVWARADRPARMLVEVATTDSFKDIRHAVHIDALPESDFTAKALIDDLPAGQDIFYRLSFQDLSSAIHGESLVGRFRTAPADRRDVSFIWSGDTAGQGWGIDESRGGMRTYATMLRCSPDFFVHCGDNIYADCPIGAEQRLPDGAVWNNIVTEEKSKVAEVLSDYRGNYKYNLLDRNLRAFNAQVPTFAQWDNHEVTNDWWPEEEFTTRANYHSGNALLLAARGRRAFHEFMPTRETLAERGRIYRKIAYGPLLDVFLLDMRSYRGPNDAQQTRAYGPDSYLFGPAQVAWLKRALVQSKAIWKVIAIDAPFGLIAGEVATSQAREPLGRAIEIADLLSFIRRADIRNTVFITAELHYTAAHYYDPNNAVFQDFAPFWEFVSGPIHAGTWGPCALEKTFGPRVVFQKTASKEQGNNLAPCFGLQFFGHVGIVGTTGVMTVTLKDVADRALWSMSIEPDLRPRPPVAAQLHG
jgi:alkaline phosphatase D